MSDDMKLNELLTFLRDCSGDEAIDLINRFQSGALTIEGISADEMYEV